MRELSYSPNALNTLTLFHRTKYIIFVEGDDDVPFWDEVFKLFGLADVHFKVAGGKLEIEKLVQTIINDGTNIVIARDCDYSDILNQQNDHKRILYTYGYSIENSMYCAPSLAKAITIYSRSAEERTSEIESWLQSLLASFEELIVYDVANEKFGKGIEVMNGKCVRFLESDKSYLANRKSIKAHIKKIERHFSSHEIDEITELLKRSKKPTFSVIRGHFLTNAIMNFIKNKANLNSLSHEMLYGQMIAQLSCCIKENDMTYLENQINRLIS